MRRSLIDRDAVTNQGTLVTLPGFLKTGYLGCFSIAVAGMFLGQSGTGKPVALIESKTYQASPISDANSPPLFERRFFESIPDAPSVHASTITSLPNGGLMAAWFGGTREGAKDVSIYGSRWDALTETWDTPSVILNAPDASRELGRYVKKLGNPVLYCDRSGRVWLYFVTVSLGGWSGSSVTIKYSDDGGTTWSDSKRLITSPFLNISNLVRSVPLEMNDGSILLPVYHEFLAKYGEILHLSPDGDLVAKYRMGNSIGSLQPTLMPVDDRTILAFHRRTGDMVPRVLANRSDDGGRTWSDTRPIDLPNPNASVAVTRRNDGGYLMALNASETERVELSLAKSADGEEWGIIRTFAAVEGNLESSYPTLIRADDGIYHLTYTWGREKICHIRFNEAWLEYTP